MIYLLTAVGLTAGGSSAVHIYIKPVHRTAQLTTHRTAQLTTHRTAQLTTHRTAQLTTHRTAQLTTHRTAQLTTQLTTHRTTQLTTHRTAQLKTNWQECGPSVICFKICELPDDDDFKMCSSEINNYTIVIHIKMC